MRPTTFDLPEELLSRLKSGSMLLADRGYDADWIRELAMKKGAWANENQPQRSDLLQPLSLSCAQPGRAVLQQDRPIAPLVLSPQELLNQCETRTLVIWMAIWLIQPLET